MVRAPVFLICTCSECLKSLRGETVACGLSVFSYVM